MVAGGGVRELYFYREVGPPKFVKMVAHLPITLRGETLLISQAFFINRVSYSTFGRVQWARFFISFSWLPFPSKSQKTQPYSGGSSRVHTSSCPEIRVRLRAQPTTAWAVSELDISVHLCKQYAEYINVNSFTLIIVCVYQYFLKQVKLFNVFLSFREGCTASAPSLIFRLQKLVAHTVRGPSLFP